MDRRDCGEKRLSWPSRFMTRRAFAAEGLAAAFADLTTLNDDGAAVTLGLPIGRAGLARVVSLQLAWRRRRRLPPLRTDVLLAPT
jgi:hypothetical protein